MDKEAKREYMKKWRAENREILLAKSRDRYWKVRKFEKRTNRRKDLDARCLLCTIKLDSKFGGKGRRSYCDDCVVRLKRKIENLYARRAYQKRTGKSVEPITPETVCV